MNVTIRGKTKEILEDMVQMGYCNTLSEAIRLSIVYFGETHFNEEALVAAKLNRIDKEIAQGKRKVLTAEEALGEHAKLLKS